MTGYYFINDCFVQEKKETTRVVRHLLYLKHLVFNFDWTKHINVKFS